MSEIVDAQEWRLYAFTMSNIETHWFALKVFYNRSLSIKQELSADGIDCYVPTETVVVERQGVRRKVVRPVISSLMFFHSTEEQAVDVQRRFTDRVILYTRFLDDGSRRPYAIPDREMQVFMLVTQSGESGLEYFGELESNFTEGQHVRVTDGPFSGAEGYIRRIRGDRRLLVTITGICAVATAYIPKQFLQQID